MNKSLQSVSAPAQRRIIGLSSGMSMDGVDVALARFDESDNEPLIFLEDSLFLPYSEDLRDKLLRRDSLTALEIIELHHHVGLVFAQAAQAMIKQRGESSKTIDAIGSHGQTIAHLPPDAMRSHFGTLQIGNPSVIAQTTGIPVIAQFREADMAAGGQGAPLVPRLDQVLLQSSPGVALGNLGSIANLSVACNDGSWLAFDMGPANMPLDCLASHALGSVNARDENGSISCQGKVCHELLSSFMNLSYFTQPPPKSAGYHQWSASFILDLIKHYPQLSLPDQLRTAVEWVAVAIQKAIETWVSPYSNLHTIIWSGGGTYNQTLMARIAELTPDIRHEILGQHSVPLALQLNQGASLVDAKEALLFALLARDFLERKPWSLLSVTGARRRALLGQWIAP